MMETNGIECAKACDSMSSLWLIIDWGRSPLMQFTVLATIAVCVGVFWLAVVNHKCMMRHELSQTDMKTIDCRIAVSKYLLLFFLAVWLLMSAACFRFLVATLTHMQPGEARAAMVQINAQPPYTLAIILIALTGIHCAIGILYEIKKRKNNGNSQQGGEHVR